MIVTPDALITTLRAAKPGDTLALTGDFPAISLSAKPGLTLDLTGATIGSLYAKGCDGLRTIGGQFRGDGTWVGGLYLAGTNGADIGGLRYQGTGIDAAIMVRGSSNVTLHDCLIGRPKVGINLLDSQKINVRSCALFGFAIDGMDVASCQDVLMELNSFSGGMLADAHHPDCLQMWTNQNGVKTARVTIRKNQFHGYAQGSSLFSHYDWDGGDSIAIEDNVYALGYPQGIALNNCTNSHVTGNVLRTLPGAAHRVSINVDATVTRSGNRVEAFGATPAMIDPN